MKLSPFQGLIDQSMLTNKLLGTMNTNMANFISEMRNVSSAPIREINQEIEKTPQKIGMAEQDVLNLAEKLKEAEAQCRAFGDTSKANKLKEMLKMINIETTDVKGSMQELRQYIEKTFGTDALKQFGQELKNIDKTTSKVGKKSNFGSNLKTALGIGTVALGIRKAVSFFKEATIESIDFVETQNLFNVSMGKTVDQYGNLDREASKYYTKAMAFQEKLADKLKINIEESMEYQALFNAMSKSMGIGDEPSYKISENFTKLGYDLASLYNIDPENAMQKLRAGLSGQTKPLRDLGLDITQQSLEPLLDELGIERSTKQLSQAEKMVARYIVVLRQASLAHGDFAKTMDSPANQLRIFNAQLTAFKRNMGSLWQGLLGGILPYVNAIMMVINELLKMIAKLFGFKVSDQNVNISAGVGADGLADDLGTATGKAKELKKQLMGFDEINNITLPDKTSGGSGASVGGIDQKLLDAMKEYDNLMDKVKSKATDIKNQIMKWLGFTGDANKDMKILKGWLDKIKTVAKVILALYIGSKLLKLIGYLRTLKGVFTGIKAPMTSFQNGLALVGKGASNLKTYLKLGVEQFKLYRNAGDGVITSLGKTSKAMFDLIPNTVKVAGGIAGLVGSSVLAYKSMEDLSKGTIDTKEAILKLTGSIGLGAGSGALIGSIFGLKGAIIGGLLGALASGVSAMFGYKNETVLATEELTNATNKTNEYIEAIKKEKEEIQEKVNNGLAEQEYYKKLANELETLVDVNGKVKEGYSDRVSFILNQLNEAYDTEYTIVDGTIEKYDELKKNIYETIEAEKAKIILNANEEVYANAIKRQVENQTKLREQIQEQNKAQQAYNDKLKELQEKYGDVEKARELAYKAPILPKDFKDFEELEKALENSKNKVNELTETITNDNEIIIYWEDLKEATITGDNKKIQEAMANLSTTYSVETDNQEKTLLDQINAEINMTKDRRRIWEENGIEINETRKQQLETGIRTLADKLLEQTNTVENLTNDQVEAWKVLAQNSEQIYNEKISNVNEDTKFALEAILGKIDVTSPEYIEKWRTMANKSNETYNRVLSQLPENTRNKIQDIVGATNSKQNDVNSSFNSLATGAINAFEQVSGYNSGENLVTGIERGVKDNKSKITKALTGLADGAVTAFNIALGIHSPSKIMAEQAKFIPEGIAKGIDDNIKTVYNSMKDLSQGIKVNPNDFEIDTNQFIDYGQISGAIATQSNIKVDSNIESRIENAIYRGLSNATIPIEIEATTDEGIIFKKVQVKAKEFYTQTGEPAFEF